VTNYQRLSIEGVHVPPPLELVLIDIKTVKCRIITTYTY